ncbi:hypothetical protein G3A56_25710 (plasmid) [Rhizobium oryzihabitans]|uniref:Uncharacterized protein n=1 Tax=Rhizobium oryzihabitans TaxID=2267833 RepID=A0A7L5BR25_9HYPH|nr:hypothetical protein [Rhizobium oryzihabitans]QIB41255.1 hypothetical protein G3A56_25710 [Rhizobium oryzihabitans]
MAVFCAQVNNYFYFSRFFYFSRRRHGGTAFPLFMVSICLIFLLNASPLIAYFVKLFSVIFTFYVDRLRPQAYSLHMALMPNERSANVPDVPVLPRNRPTPQGFLRRILAKLKPNGSTKIALEISIPLFLKITVEHTFKSATRKR